MEVCVIDIYIYIYIYSNLPKNQWKYHKYKWQPANSTGEILDVDFVWNWSFSYVLLTIIQQQSLQIMHIIYTVFGTINLFYNTATNFFTDLSPILNIFHSHLEKIYWFKYITNLVSLVLAIQRICFENKK